MLLGWVPEVPWPIGILINGWSISLVRRTNAVDGDLAARGNKVHSNGTYNSQSTGFLADHTIMTSVLGSRNADI